MKKEFKTKLKEFVENNRFTNAYYVAGYMDAIGAKSLVRDETANNTLPLKSIDDFEGKVKELKDKYDSMVAIDIPSQVKIYQNRDGVKAIATMSDSLLTLSSNGYSLIGPIDGQRFEKCDPEQFIMKECSFEELIRGDIFFDGNYVKNNEVGLLTSEELYILFDSNGRFCRYTRGAGISVHTYINNNKTVFKLCRKK